MACTQHNYKYMAFFFLYPWDIANVYMPLNPRIHENLPMVCLMQGVIGITQAFTSADAGNVEVCGFLLDKCSANDLNFCV